MKKLILSFILLLSVQLTYSQIEPEWVAIYNGVYSLNDIGREVAFDDNGNIYVTGNTSSSPNSDCITIKYGPDGTQIWVRTYNGPDNLSDDGVDIAVDRSGNVYVVGDSYSSITGDDYLTIKYNTDGILQWTKRYNGPENTSDEAKAIAVDNAGNVYVTGESKGVGTYDDYATIKYDTNGNLLWVKRYNGPPGGSNSDWAYAITVDKSGNVYVTGGSDGGELAFFDYATIKYSPDGNELWVKRYNGTGSINDIPSAITVDEAGNVYVTGESRGVEGTNDDYATIKYSANGEEIWVRRYSGIGNSTDKATSIAIDYDENVFVTGHSGTYPNVDYLTIKYNSNGDVLWTKAYNNNQNTWDMAVSIGLDGIGNVYVTGYTGVGPGWDITTIKYNSGGDQLWEHTYNGPGNDDDKSFAMAVDQLGNVYVTGYSTGIGTQRDVTTMKFAGTLRVLEPALNDKWIAGETDTIKWTETDWLSVNIKCILNFETPIEEEIILAEGYPVVDSEFEWEIPDTLLSYRSKIIIENANNPVEKIESGIFRIKPYVLTRLNADSTYYDYRKDRDQWGFSNMQADIWPQTWYNQFNYQGTDPFTNNLQYSQTQGDSVFAKIAPTPHAHIDWISWVNTFGVDACYFAAYNGMYKPTALAKWWANLGLWAGSCFGIAAANALAFEKKELFLTKYPDFPEFVTPISVDSSDAVRKIINELFTYQFGNPHNAHTLTNWTIKTPNQTLNDIKELLSADISETATLSIWNNNGNGGHNILPYALKKDTTNPNIYLLYVYDNSNPNSINPITFNTTANSDSGSWNTPDWINQPSGLPWGGFGKIILMDPATNYLGNPIMPKQNITLSPFILDNNELQIFSRIGIDIQISNQLNEQIGHINGTLIDNLPGAVPQYILNGSETPPIGYSLPTDNYSVVLNEFEGDTISTFFFTGNKSFIYERSGAIQTQTDRLFFDGGVSVANPDAQTKTVKLLNLINETTQEKLTVIRSIELAQNDSVKIENPDSNKVKLISYGSAKDYDIELNYVTENGLGRFGDFNIPLSANTSHIFIPDWSDLTNTELQVLVDIGNDGSIDDTLSLINQVTGIGDDQGSLLTPNSFNLAQNFPNPFNPSTKISWQSPVGSHQTLKVYDILGNEVATLVNEYREAGSYAVEFDASQLASGIYLYKLQAGSFVQTRKMILLR